MSFHAATRISVGEARAAQLLDMRQAEFRALVEAGHLPRGREIAPGYIRWSTDELRRIASGDASDGMADVKW